MVEAHHDRAAEAAERDIVSVAETVEGIRAGFFHRVRGVVLVDVLSGSGQETVDFGDTGGTGGIGRPPVRSFRRTDDDGQRRVGAQFAVAHPETDPETALRTGLEAIERLLALLERRSV